MSLLCPSPNTAYFYPRSPCGERPVICFIVSVICLFLSTLSLRRATGLFSSVYLGYIFLSTLSLRRATNSETQSDPAKSISIHALLAESDKLCLFLCHFELKFLSTLSLRRATCAVSVQVGGNVYFYPRSPCGERPF